MYKYTNTTKTRKFFKKAVTNIRRITLTKQKLLLGAKKWRYIIHYVLVVLMAILGAMFPDFLVKAIKSTDKNEADGALFGARVILGMLMLIVGMFLDAW